MNKLKTLEILSKLADQLDSKGLQKQANFVDQMIDKVAADNLIPIGEVYQDEGKNYRKFQDQSRGTLVVKEVTPEGQIIGTSSPIVSNDPSKPSAPATETAPSMFSGLYNVFDEISDAIMGKPVPAPKDPTQPVDVKSNPAKDKSKKTKSDIDESESDVLKEYYKQLTGLKKKLKELGIELGDGEPTMLKVKKPSDLTILNEPTMMSQHSPFSFFDEQFPELTEIVKVDDDIDVDDLTIEKTKISDNDEEENDVSQWLEDIS